MHSARTAQTVTFTSTTLRPPVAELIYPTTVMVLPPVKRSTQQRTTSSTRTLETADDHDDLRYLVKSGNMELAVNALQRMPAPRYTDYNLVLEQYAREGRVTEAESLVKHMVDRCVQRDAALSGNVNNDNCDDDDGKLLQPNRYTYYLLLDALLLSGQRQAAERAEEILLAVVENFGSAATVAYNNVLKMWKIEARRNPDVAAERAERLLAIMLELDIADRISYSHVIATRAIQGDAERAFQLAEHVISLDDGNLHPNTQTWNTVLHAWVRQGELERAEQVLRTMEQAAEKSVNMIPNVVTYSTLIDGWAKSDTEDSLTKMNYWFDRMKEFDCIPNFRTYVILLHGYAKRGDPQRAQDLLLDMHRMAEHQNRPELQPNTKLVTAVMDAWQRSGQGAEQAEALLNWMVQVGEECPDLAPNEYSFSCK